MRLLAYRQSLSGVYNEYVHLIHVYFLPVKFTLCHTKVREFNFCAIKISFESENLQL